LFRYQLIQDVVDPGLSARQRGAVVRELAGREHDGPGGAKVAVSEQTIRRWVRDWRSGGFDALVPQPARVTPRTPAEVLELAVALKKENPARTATQITRILRAQSGWSPGERTLQRHFARLELNKAIQALSGAKSLPGLWAAAMLAVQPPGMMIGGVPSSAVSDLHPACWLAGLSCPAARRRPRTPNCWCCGTRSPCCAAPSPSLAWTGPAERCWPR